MLGRTLTRSALFSVLTIASFVPVIASAGTQIVLDTDPAWGAWGNSGGGSSVINDAAPRSGNGSLELRGDRTRFSPNVGIIGGSLSNLSAFGYDWMIASDSTNTLDPDYTPALRLHLSDGSQLIWEGAYNGVYGNNTKGVWYTTDLMADGQSMWRWNGGVDLDPTGAQKNYSISKWASELNGVSILNVSIGAGSSASSGYHAFADNLVAGFGDSEPTTYNFEVQAVPEPATMAIFGLGMAALAARRRRSRN